MQCDSKQHRVKLRSILYSVGYERNTALPYVSITSLSNCQKKTILWSRLICSEISLQLNFYPLSRIRIKNTYRSITIWKDFNLLYLKIKSKENNSFKIVNIICLRKGLKKYRITAFTSFNPIYWRENNFFSWVENRITQFSNPCNSQRIFYIYKCLSQ